MLIVRYINGFTHFATWAILKALFSKLCQNVSKKKTLEKSSTVQFGNLNPQVFLVQFSSFNQIHIWIITIRLLSSSIPGDIDVAWAAHLQSAASKNRLKPLSGLTPASPRGMKSSLWTDCRCFLQVDKWGLFFIPKSPKRRLLIIWLLPPLIQLDSSVMCFSALSFWSV